MVIQKRNFKIEWAKVHLDTLKSSIAAFKAEPAKLYGVSTKEDHEQQLLFITIVSINPVELMKLGLIAGDFICNLRASLDHLAWTLAKLGKKKPSGDTCFPIIGIAPRTQAEIDERIAACTRGMPADAVTAMKTFQPYHSGNAYKSHHLWRLHFLWNLDKHRNIALYSADSGVVCEIASGVPVTRKDFNDRAVVSLPLSAKDKVRFNRRPDIKILFGDEERGIQVSVEDLGAIYEFVSTEVFPIFARFVPQIGTPGSPLGI